MTVWLPEQVEGWNVYVAGASGEAIEVAALIAKLEGLGHTCTFDWTREVLSRRAAGKTDADLTQFEAACAATGCLDGVDRADILWLVVPQTESIGAWVELGYAMARGKILCASGRHSRTIFGALVHNTFPTHEDVIRWLAK